MAIKKLVLSCNCEPPMCEHAYDKVRDMLQSGYDDGYDEGWKDAFVAIKQGLLDMGFDRASSIPTPEPPPRRGSSQKNKPRKNEVDLLN